MKRFYIKLQLIILFIVFSLFPKDVLGIVKFNTDYQNFYRVNPDGTTHVSFVINQKNNLSIVYATDFGLNINETKVSNVKVSDEGTIIIPDIVKTLNQTTISFPFANKVVGKDKIHSFTVEYDTTDIATKFGNTWEINIPRLETDENLSSRAVILTVPDTFPVPAYIDPKPDSVVKNTYYFSGNKIGNKSISAVFGQTQFYKGKISYHLINDSKINITTEIALPPDTAYQTVYYENLNPRPDKVVTDIDGNYLAQYTLKGDSKLDVDLSIFVKLNFVPKPTDKQPLDQHLISNATWNFDNNVFTTPEIKNLTTPRSIFDYVVDKMTYDYEKVNRQKSQKIPAAESLLNHQSAICTDFANVFVSLSRKAGIHSRELEGYAISENPDLKPISLTQDVLHAWPEFYDKETKTWIQVDPTWTNTTRGIDYFNKLDFNHIVFAIHGINPDYPIPAGGYKYMQEKTKDISIEPSDPVVFPDPNIYLEQEKIEKKTLILNVINSYGVAYSGNTINENGDYFQESEQYLNIPPFGEAEISLPLKKQPILREIKTKVIIYINGKRYEQPVTITPAIPKIAFYSLIGVVLGLAAFSARRIYIRRQKQKTVIYR